MFEAPTTTLRERKQLIRAVIDEIAITVRAEQRVAQLRILWQGGAVTEVSMPMTKPGQHLRVTDEATVGPGAPPRAQHYDDRTIAAILAKQKRRTATGLPFTRARVAILRAGHNIPVYQPPTPMSETDCDDVVVVTITASRTDARRLPGNTLYRWIRDGFVTAEQITAGAPWRIRIDVPSATGSDPRSPRAGSVSTRQPSGTRRSPVRPCCTRSNAANRTPSTSTADAAKGSASRYEPDQHGLFDTP